MADYENIRRRLRAVPPLSQTVAKLLAMFFRPAHSGEIMELSKLLHIGVDGEQSISKKDALTGIHELERDGLVKRESGSFYLSLPAMEVVVDLVADEGWAEQALRAVQRRRRSQYYAHHRDDWQQQFSLAAMTGSKEVLDDVFQKFTKSFSFNWATPSLHPALLRPRYLKGLSDTAVVNLVVPLVPARLYSLKPVRSLLRFLKELPVADYPNARRHAGVLLADACILMGAPAKATEFLDTPGVRAAVAFVRGECDRAEELFREETARLSGSSTRHSVPLPGLQGLFAGMSALRQPDAAGIRVGRTRLNAALKENAGPAEALQVLKQMAEYRLNPRQEVEIHGLGAFTAEDEPDEEFLGYSNFEQTAAHLQGSHLCRHAKPPATFTVDLLITLLVKTWTDSEWTGSRRLLEQVEELRANGYAWAAAQLEALATGNSDWLDDNNQANLATLLEPEPKWQRQLAALAEVVPAAGRELEATKPSKSRLCWLVSAQEMWDDDHEWRLKPYEQRPKKRGGGYTKGKAVSLSRFYGQFDFDGDASDQDRAIAACVQKAERYSYTYGEIDGFCFSPAVWKALIGHPRVFWQDLKSPLEVVAEDPQLVLRGHGDDMELSFNCRIPDEPGVHLELDELGRLCVREVRRDHTKIAEIIGEGLRIPAAGREELTRIIAGMSEQLTVQSDLALETDSLETVTVDQRLRVRLVPFGDDGLQAAVVVCPLGDEGPSCEPGEGAQHVVAQVAGKRLSTTRDLAGEKEKARELFAACEILAMTEDCGWHSLLPTPELALQALLELQSVDSQEIVIEWPEGEKLKLRRQLDSSDLGLHVTSGRDWFALEGEVKVDDEMVFNLQQLLRLAQRREGNFVQLEDGTFVALTRHFRRLLDDLSHVCTEHRDELRIHPLAAPVLEELVEDVQVETCDEWRRRLLRLQEANTMAVEVPTTLEAQLRDYQTDGVHWLLRLAHCGIGACLADDMGLGKTVQALAAVLARAPDGPSLVVAPASVIQNWADEARRFAPTLRPIFLHDGERQKTMDRLGAFDLLIATYGIMQNEIESLKEIKFQTIVLDEAQAIKNRQTKRARAAFQLDGRFRITTTGTPIENHLSELWSLFRFLNPGFLGSYDSFNTHFGIPIERDHDRSARQALRRLVTPFILRRLKNEILEELPPKTEIELQVDLSESERAFYEALRREAVERLESGVDEDSRFAVLAEITRLRRACCNPQLVQADVDLPSAKLQLFLELVEELLENRHRALVFSQFVGHLDLIREVLDARDISYCYLDGSTPLKQRQQQVDAFQAGDAELFLISLKAGGTGLNLTAADYVIHMDPWWNPAVEDQASDRAHRIGQTRPVTIYRLITEGTIEEKIVKLHRTKKDLANSLLEGTDQTGRLDLNEMLQLLRED